MGGVTGGELPVGANVGVGALARRRRSSTRRDLARLGAPRFDATNANNPRGAGGGAARGALPHRGASGGRAEPRALPAAARPRHRCSGADVPCALRRCEARAQVAAVLCRGRDARRARLCGDGRGGCARRPHHHWLGRWHLKCGATAYASAPSTQMASSEAWRASAVRASSAARTTRTAKLWTLDGYARAHLRTFMMPGYIAGVATLPDGVHFVVAHNDHVGGKGEVRLYHVDGTLVHTFTRGTRHGGCGGGDARRPAHHQRRGLQMQLNVWSVADKSLVRTCRGGTTP